MEFCRSGLIVVWAYRGLACCFVVCEILFTLKFSSDTNSSYRQINHISWCMLTYTPMTSRNYACTRKLIAMRLRVSIICHAYHCFLTLLCRRDILIDMNESLVRAALLQHKQRERQLCKHCQLYWRNITTGYGNTPI